MGRGRGAPYDINDAWRSWAVSYSDASTSDARSAANLVAWADMASSQALSWLIRVSMSFMLRGRGNDRTTLVPGGSVSLSMPWRRG
ncbi:hypothetical protein BHE74_00052620 [Ensete ventricosum]|nr:hypothetical protein BHE74_00052620 [Ensete ventricosum]